MPLSKDETLANRSIITGITTFIAGICFAAILLLYQFKNTIDGSVVTYLTLSLSLSVVFLTFAALSCVIASDARGSNLLVGMLLAGFTTFFASLYFLLSLLNELIALTCVAIAVTLFLIILGIMTTSELLRKEEPIKSDHDK
ncbi:MAG: hypothetical protein ABSG33_05195 [Candidatus Bathyarchaeia archaeon]